MSVHRRQAYSAARNEHIEDRCELPRGRLDSKFIYMLPSVYVNYFFEIINYEAL